mgnify:CR=1 FL=1
MRGQAKIAAFAGLLAAAGVLFGYVELLFPLDFIAPGVKLGLANAVALYLICCNRPGLAFAVNTVRILLSALLFTNAFTLLFSLTAGLGSTAAMALAAKTKRFGVLGVSLWGAFTHNLLQWALARAIFSAGVTAYLPFLLLAAVLTGSLLGFAVYLLLKRFCVFKTA